MLHAALTAVLSTLVPHGPADTAGRHGPVGSSLHAVAFVNDSLSHGTLGDGFLSLNEAIRLHNRTLQFSQLSLAEQNQISGFGLDVGWADIDESSTPVITVQQPLDPIVDMPHGFLIGGTNGRPVIDFTGTNSGFVAVSDFCNWRELIVRGGSWGIDLTQTNAVYGTQIVGVEFEQVATFGVRVRGNGAGLGRVLFDDCRFTAVPDAIVFDETAAGRSGFYYANRTRISGGNRGIDLMLGDGGSTVCQFDKLEVSNLVSGVRVLRPNGGSRTLLLQATYWDVRSFRCFTCEATQSLQTQLIMRFIRMRTVNAAGSSITVFGAPVLAASLQEWTAEGNSNLGASAPGSVQLENWRYRSGSLSIDAATDDAVVLSDSRFVGANLIATGAGRLRTRGCSFDSGGLTTLGTGPLLVTDSYASGPFNGNVQVVNGVAGPQLGSMSVTPDHPTLASVLTLQGDLPAGYFGLFAMGVTAEYPTIQPYPIHVYMEPGTIFTFPGIYTGQQSTSLSVPNNLALQGTDWTAQVVVLPGPGTLLPALSLPPGQRFVVR